MAITAPDVSPEPIPSVRFSADTTPTTFGGGPSIDQQVQETQRISSDTSEIATFEKIRADQTAVEDAQSKAIAAKQDILYNPDSGVLGSKGLDAVQAHQDGIVQLQKSLNKISSSLNGDQQVGPFNKWAQGLAGVANQTMMSHVDTQLTQHRDETFSSVVDQSSASAALNHGNPDAIDFYRNTANQAALNYARDNRLDPDGTSKLVRDTNDKVQIGVINGMLKYQGYDQAKAYLDANQDNISPKAQEAIQGSLAEGSIRSQATKAANDAISSNPNSEVDSLAAVNKIQNPNAQDMARKIVSERFEQKKQAMKNDQDTAFLQSVQTLNQKGITDPAQRRMAVPEAIWNKFSSEQQRAIEKGRTPDESSPLAWEKATRLISDKTLGSLSQADLNSKILPDLDASDRKTIIDYWSGMKKNGGAGGPKEKSYETVLQMQDDALVASGALNPKNPTPKQLVFKKQFQDGVDRDLSVQEAAVGRPLKQDEIQKVVDSHTLKVINAQGGNWFPTVPYDKIPDADKQHVIELARSAGVTATKSHIEDAYAKHKQGKSDAEIIKALQ